MKVLSLGLVLCAALAVTTELTAASSSICATPAGFADNGGSSDTPTVAKGSNGADSISSSGSDDTAVEGSKETAADDNSVTQNDVVEQNEVTSSSTSCGGDNVAASKGEAAESAVDGNDGQTSDAGDDIAQNDGSDVSDDDETTPVKGGGNVATDSSNGDSSSVDGSVSSESDAGDVNVGGDSSTSATGSNAAKDTNTDSYTDSNIGSNVGQYDVDSTDDSGASSTTSSAGSSSAPTSTAASASGSIAQSPSSSGSTAQSSPTSSGSTAQSSPSSAGSTATPTASSSFGSNAAQTSPSTSTAGSTAAQVSPSGSGSSADQVSPSAAGSNVTEVSSSSSGSTPVQVSASSSGSTVLETSTSASASASASSSSSSSLSSFTKVTSLQVRVQGDMPEWNADNQRFVSSYYETFDEKYRAVLDTVNMAAVEGALKYVQAECINSSAVTDCERKNNIKYVVFYQTTIAQPVAAMDFYANATDQHDFAIEHCPFMAMDGGQCNPNSDGSFPDVCNQYIGADGQPDLGFCVGGTLQDNEAIAPYPHNYWFSFPNSCPQELWDDKTETCREKYAGGLCPLGVEPDGVTCTFSYEILGYILLDDVVGITSMINPLTLNFYADYKEFCEAGGIEFAVSLLGDLLSWIGGLPFWANPGDSDANTERVEKLVSAYDDLVATNPTTSDGGVMKALPTIEALQALNPPCYENSPLCAEAEFGCSRSYRSQICEVCTSADSGCVVKP
ncbi:hypothetical protein PHYBOEH_006932 [Phytophthora boehmeriae]|uniref:Uncharacterized protein n=1 Tax=Phytophthora boehmeriae TaxID=109152 RepID=A0A8T1WEF8_9STRA|nr:hypothetical protein PHYBOEH_006932 [Phytophthora boehmeriae]